MLGKYTVWRPKTARNPDNQRFFVLHPCSLLRAELDLHTSKLLFRNGLPIAYLGPDWTEITYHQHKEKNF
ncbi:hypothetical protein D3C79_884570 [compost metagenome]